MKHALTLAFALAMTGCASSGVIPLDKDNYMLTRQSAGGAFGSPAALMAELYGEANAFCSARQSAVQSVQETPRDGIPFVRIASAELRFRCVPK